MADLNKTSDKLNNIYEANTEVANDIYSWLHSLIDDGDLVECCDNILSQQIKLFVEELLNNVDLTESFKNKAKLESHFKKHCLANENKTSTKRNIFYDFMTQDEYADYEKLLSTKFLIENNERIIIDSFEPKIFKEKVELFLTGNKYLYFMPIYNYLKDGKLFSFGFHSFASNVTTNYSKEAAIDFITFNENKNTTTLYALSASLCINKLKNTVLKSIEIADGGTDVK